MINKQCSSCGGMGGRGHTCPPNIKPEASITVDGREYAVPGEVADTFLAVSLERDELKTEVMKWISVKDRLPERTDKILCYEPNTSNGIFDWTGADLIDDGPDITHWMPLPKPPGDR